MSGPRVLSSRRPWSGRMVRVRVDRVLMPGGAEVEREVVEHPGAAAVLALLEDGQVVLVEQYRHAALRSLLEVPAGMLAPGEDPLACAQRELAEETGYSAGRWEPLLTFYTSPGFTDEAMHLFLATALESGPARPEPDEGVRPRRMPLVEALALARAGRIVDAKTIIALQAAASRGIPSPRRA